MARNIKYRLRELADAVGGKVVGEEKRIVTGVASLESATENDLTFCVAPKYLPLLEQTGAGAVIVPAQMRVPQSCPDRIVVERIDDAFNDITEMFIPDYTKAMTGIDALAAIDKEAVVSPDATIGPFVIIRPGAHVGPRTRILGGTYIGYDAVVGEDCLIYPNVSILDRVKIGNHVTIHSGTVLGSDGFGFAMDRPGHPKQRQLGTVEVCDDVEIGACCTIDRARLEKTSIGRGTKLDNLVHVAHNVRIGEHCFIVAQVGIAGSTTIGNNVILAGQAGVDGHLTIGDDVQQVIRREKKLTKIDAGRLHGACPR
ncbi:MAG: UDP-3-O-(3-hydroxymyristoyl)glucosamine N-acyltransferase [Planctomycetota bacterium]|jgi:UDP-3-O-[3-hydroxymyristoyl] glucosamine N-acyltransferase